MTFAGQRIQRRILQVCLAASIILLLWGMARLWLDDISHAQATEAFAALHSPVALLEGVVRAEPVPLICLGIAVLAVTPVLRLLLLLIDFLAQRDWLYAAICAAVGVIIAVGFMLRLH